MKYFKGQIDLKGTYEVKFYDDCFKVFNKNGNFIYYEDSSGYWYKREYDENGNWIYYENSNGNIVDERPNITIELTQEQLDKINEILKEE